jgi:1-aminocyclopropane-1-carboxylate deaminase/D-cysteine desulfhydrase-like pyridoxal-dependent ACC family enzyme
VDLAQGLPAAVHAHGEDAPDVIVVASGSGGTAAGLLAAGWPVCAVRVGPRALTNRARLRHFARRGGAERLGTLHVEHGFLAGGYGQVDEPTLRAWEAGRAAGLPVETTYSAKALACALERARGGERVLFVQTASAVEASPAPPLPTALDALLLHLGPGSTARAERPD